MSECWCRYVISWCIWTRRHQEKTFIFSLQAVESIFIPKNFNYCKTANRAEKKRKEKKIHLNSTKESEDNDIIYPAVFSFWNTMQSDAWKISGTTVGWTAGGNFGDIIRVVGSFCSFVIFSSKALIALVSSYLPDDEHSVWTMLTWSHTASWCHLLEEK